MKRRTDFASPARRITRLCAAAFALGLIVVRPAAPARAQQPAGVYTYHDNTMRTGTYTDETVLAPSNVSSQTFGKLFASAIDASAHAQPLYVPGVNIPGAGIHNMVYVATENDSVYAFDADTGALLWHRSFIDPANGVTAVPYTDTGCTNITPEVGITGTPVIDPSTATLYVVAMTKENGAYFHRLHALNIATGAEEFGGPVAITASAPGTGTGSVGATVTMQQLRALQRSALLLENGVVYVAFASNCDLGPYDGWVLGYDASNLSQVYAYNDDPDGAQAGIWMSGGGPAAAPDSGDIYLSTGNGIFDANTGGPDYGDSVLRLSPEASALMPIDFFTPSNEATLSFQDLDLGSAGVTLLPDQTTGPPHLLVTSGKQGTIYLINRDDMGGFNSSGDQIVQELVGAVGPVYNTPSFWNGTMYLIGRNDVPKAFVLSGGKFNSTPVSQSTVVFPYTGATTSISSNGASDGIVWVIWTTGASTVPVLYAFDASDLSNELYAADENSPRDIGAGKYVTFSVPTVANGKVYVGTTSELDAYGLFDTTPGGAVSVLAQSPANFKRHGWTSGGSFEIQNTSDAPERVTSVAIRFTSPALFSAARLKGKAGRTRRHGRSRAIKLTTTFTLNRSLIVGVGQAAQFTLRLKAARKRASSDSSTVEVYQVAAGPSWLSGLPAILGTIGGAVKRRAAADSR